jgi:dihydroorotase
MGLDKGTLKTGADADITIVDLNMEVVIDAALFASKGKNTPFDKWRLMGMPVITIVGGVPYAAPK